MIPVAPSKLNPSGKVGLMVKVVPTPPDMLGASGVIAVFAQSEKFNAAMKKSLAEMETSFKNPADLITAANNFERIAIAEKNQGGISRTSEAVVAVAVLWNEREETGCEGRYKCAARVRRV